MNGALYNEIDPFAAQWLENLVAAGHIEPGRVERRSIEALKPSEIPERAHFFAGIGVWSYALRRAGWPDDLSVWTGSCPCQPFSQAGSGGGTSDPRHLWPSWFKLIRECRPPVVFGEQVASADGLHWLDSVCSDLEGENYTVAAVDLSAAGVGAPHIRQRLFFVAHTPGWRLEARDLIGASKATTGERQWAQRTDVYGKLGSMADADTWRLSEQRQAHDDDGSDAPRNDAHRRSAAGGLGNADSDARRQGGENRGRSPERGGKTSWPRLSGASSPRGLGDTSDAGREGLTIERASGSGNERPPTERAGATRGFWADADWLACTDGVSRPVEPGTFPLAHGVAGRVGRLRAYGNAIVAEVAVTFIRAAMEAMSS